MCAEARRRRQEGHSQYVPETGAKRASAPGKPTQKPWSALNSWIWVFSHHSLLMPGFTKDIHTNPSSQVILWISWYHDIQVSSHTRHKESLRTEWMASELNGDQDYSRKVQENLGLKGCQFLKPTGDHWQFRKNGYSHTPFSNISYSLVRHKSFVLPFTIWYYDPKHSLLVLNHNILEYTTLYIVSR